MAEYDDDQNRNGGNADSSNLAGGDDRIPVMQQLLDNPFLLLFIGVTMPTVFYIIWGIMEIITIPIAP